MTGGEQAREIMTTYGNASRFGDVARGARARRAAIVGTLFGNALEWFDFILYGILAGYLARAFFPQSDPGVALLQTFAIFGAGFLFRPLGAILIGWVGDTKGRKPAFLLTIALMAAGTIIIGLLPTYATIGILAPALLLVARLLQGLSAGGELGIAISFLTEWSPRERRGYVGSFISMTVSLGSLAASGVATLLITILPADAMNGWGWRVPFLIGGILGLIGRWLRARTEETPLYSQFRHGNSTRRSQKKADFVQSARAFGLTIHWTVCFYMFLVYLPTYARVHAGLTATEASLSNTICLLAIACLIPFIGSLSDRLGRKPFLIASCLIVALFTFPALWMILIARNFYVVAALQVLFALAIALYSGPTPAFIAELFSTSNRARLTAMSYALAVAIFGGFAPFFADWLIRETGTPYAPALYVIAAALISFYVVANSPETVGKELD